MGTRANRAAASAHRPVELVGPDEIPPAEQVVDGRALRPFVIEVTFADGLVKEIDLAGRLAGGVFLPLKEDPSLFMQGAFDPGSQTIAWPNGADLAPEFLRFGEQQPGRAHD